MVSESRDRTALLDHGYVQLIETWGSDERIIEAARMSTAKGFLGWGPVDCLCVHNLAEEANVKTADCPKCKGTGKVEGDERLLRYLWEHKHATPFEMAGMIIEVQAPIIVFREWHRHRTQSYNEMSGRYTRLPDTYYVPSLERMMAAKQSSSNKQASDVGGATFTAESAEILREALRQSYRRQRAQYEDLLASGVAREIARLVLPVAQYSRMRASANLRNWLAFLTLRMDPAAQWEIRQYANAVGELITNAFPRTWELFIKEKR